MTIKIILLPVVLLSASALAEPPSAIKSPAKLNWSSGQEKSNCIGDVCVTVDNHKKPGMFDRIDKTDRQRMTDPFASSSDNTRDNQKTLSFTFGDGS